MKHNFYQIFFFYISLLLFFLIFGTLILSYSLGYRYDFNKKQIIKTGIIRLNPIEKNCLVFLDSNQIKLKKNQRTVEIPNLLPNNYKVEIQCSNYQTWTKSIDIYAGKIHNENNILMLPTNPSVKEIAFINQNVIYNSNLAYVKAEKIYSLTKDSDQNQYFSKAVIQPQSQIKWLNDNIISILDKSEKNTTIQILNIYNGNLASFIIDYSLDQEQIVGIDSITNETLYFFHDQNLYKINIGSQKNENPIIILENIYNPVIYNNHIYYQQSENSNQIEVYNLLFRYKSVIKFDSNVSSFFIIPGKNWLIYNSNNQSNIYEIHSTRQTPLNTTINNYIISPDQQNIILKNNNEIVVVNNNLDTNTLLRLSNTIDSVVWENNNNIFYSTNGSIKRIDINGNNNQIITENPNQYSYTIANSNQEKILVIEKRPDSNLLKYIYIKID